ncbi:hypothetical protein DMENIID0001_171250 [Sergentomyia squamirostris]
MTDSMKFGPEWLRNMSNDTGTGTGNSAQRHQLAEFRYGREEMLSLFDKNIKVPEILPKFKNLFVEKIQCPLALTPSTEDDLRVWQVRSSPGLGLSSRGARGGLIDRGRGRGRGSYHSLGGYQRSSSLYDEEGRIIGRGERWPERNGTDAGDWNGLSSTSPRKEYNSHGRGGSQENWRRSRVDDEPSEGWRSTSIPGTREKWTRSTSWRDEEPGEMTSSLRTYNSDRGFTRMIPTSGTARKFWDHEDNLPEWAMENPLESGGSFDATGAFHGSDDDLRMKRGGMVEGDEKDGSPKELRRRRVLRQESSSFSGSDNNEVDSDKNEEMKNCSEEVEEKEPPEVLPVENHHHLVKKEEVVNSDIPLMNQEKISVIVTTSTTIIASAIVTTSEARGGMSGGMNGGEQQPKPMHQMKKEIVEFASVDRMQEVADDMVEKLIMEDEIVGAGPMVGSMRSKMHSPMVKESSNLPQPNHPPTMPPITPETESNLVWFYRDPQDMVQGPFTAIEMAEWYQAGYFDDNLYVRRMGDQRFSKLGELIEMCGGEMPFFAPYRILPAQLNEVVPPVPPPVNLLDDPSMNFQMLRKQYIWRQQALVYQKLSTSDYWHVMTPEQQREMVNKQVAHMGIPDNIFTLLSAMQMEQPQQQHSNHPPLNLQDLMANAGGGGGGGFQAQLLQMQHQQKLLNSAHPPPPHPLGPFGPQQHFNPQGTPSNAGGNAPMPSDPMKQLMQNINLGNLVHQPHGPQQQPPPMPHRMPLVMPMAQKTEQQSQNDRIKSLILQLSMQKGVAAQPPPPSHPSSHSASHPPPPPQDTTGTAQWAAAMQQQPPPQQPDDFLPQPPKSNQWLGGNPVEAARGMWDLPPPPPSQQMPPPNIEMKTEKQILEEQQQQMARKINEEKLNFFDMRPASPEPTTTTNKFLDIKQPGASSGDIVSKMEKSGKKEDKSSPPTTVKKAEEKVVKQPEDKSKKKPDPKVQQNALKQLKEDERRREEEKKKKKLLEEEKKREEPKRAIVKTQQQGQAVGKNKTSKSSVAPWSNSDHASPGMSLAEIQKAEMEHRAEQSRFEQMLRDQQQQQQRLMDMQTMKDTVLPKWNAQSLGPPVVKSLVEIQAEEQAKAAAAEREHQLVMATNHQVPVAQPKTGGGGAVKREETNHNNMSGLGTIWNSSSAQNLTWNSGKLWGGTSNSGFWEEPTKPSTSFATAAAAAGAPPPGQAKNVLSKSQTMTNIQTAKTNAASAAAASTSAKNQVTAKPTKVTNAPNAATRNQVPGKSATRAPRKDDGGSEFTSWCIKALAAMNSTVDIPTFVAFLQDIESPYEVKDYIRMYLGETKECTEFAKQFLERRSKYKNQIRAQNAHVDDMCSPAPAITPSTDCQEIKGKGKKVKKNKMMKLDSRILGFSVTAAQDRINVGDRDYPNAS